MYPRNEKEKEKGRIVTVIRLPNKTAKVWDQNNVYKMTEEKSSDSRGLYTYKGVK